MTEGSSGKLRPAIRIREGDRGVRQIDGSDSEEHFSDAETGLSDPSTLSSPIHTNMADKTEGHAALLSLNTRLKKLGDSRVDGGLDNDEERIGIRTPSRPSTPGGHPIPMTVVEKVDPGTPSYGEIPGTDAHEKRKADAVPDLVLKAEDGRMTPIIGARSRANTTPGNLPIPITKVEKVDLRPSHGEVPGSEAYEMRKTDAEPDVVEEVGDVKGSPTLSIPRSSTVSRESRQSFAAENIDVSSYLNAKAVDYNYDEDGDGDENADFGDDFDDFEEGDEEAEFGDFDNGFQEAALVQPPPPQSIPIAPSFPVLNFDDLDSPEEILAATEPYIDALFPLDTISTSTLLTPTTDNPIFLTQRSVALWSQLVAPPPLQPPDWIRSRIRRLFLVSLGVPVDLDEILPASKQKKLILPSTITPRNSASISRLKTNDGYTSSTSVDSQGKPSHSKRRKGPLPAPELDLVYARQLCGVTDEALAGMMDRELKEHVGELEAMQGVAEEVLAYWTKKTDEKIGDREAFEGVIENLVKHARKVRK